MGKRLIQIFPAYFVIVNQRAWESGGSGPWLSWAKALEQLGYISSRAIEFTNQAWFPLGLRRDVAGVGYRCSPSDGVPFFWGPSEASLRVTVGRSRSGQSRARSTRPLHRA